ncbi:MAG: putative Ig domain-containing protein, partial [Planctomycetota bacterium]
MFKISWAFLVLVVAVSASTLDAQTMMPLPNHGSTYTGNTRGYWFTAPTDFTITGLRVPTTASTGAQSIEVVRLTAAPPAYSATTNNFTSLFRVVNDATTNVLTTNIPVSTGDVIGILGCRGTSNSYATGQYVSNIDGNSVTLTRMGMQYQLPTTTARDLWTEVSGSISRVEMYYTVGLTVTTNSLLPSGAEGTAYNATIQADHGTTPYTWANLSGTGALPAGLSLTAGTNNDYILSGTPATASAGTYTFTVQVTDAVPDVNTKVMTVYIMPPPAQMPFNDDFSSNTGWQLDTGWQRGSATAYNNTVPTRSEPGTDTSPSADNNILGHNIGADYPASMGATVWATSPPFDCSTAATVSLRFERWLGCSLGDTAKIQVSNNGTTWNDVWTAPTSGSNTNDTAWVYTGYDITTWAAGNAVVQVRFGIGPTNTTVNTGWCIDDFEIVDPGPELEVREGGFSGTLITDDQAVGGLRDFGQLLEGTNSTVLDIDLYNNGVNTITFSAWTKTGTNPNEFFVITSPANTIAPGNRTTMQIQFNSGTSGAGVYTATINLPHTAVGSGTSPWQINVRAEAVANNPLIQVDMTTSGGTNIPHQNPATGTARDFGNVMVGSSS